MTDNDDAIPKAWASKARQLRDLTNQMLATWRDQLKGSHFEPPTPEGELRLAAKLVVASGHSLASHLSSARLAESTCINLFRLLTSLQSKLMHRPAMINYLSALLRSVVSSLSCQRELLPCRTAAVFLAADDFDRFAIAADRECSDAGDQLGCLVAFGHDGDLHLCAHHVDSLSAGKLWSWTAVQRAAAGVVEQPSNAATCTGPPSMAVIIDAIGLQVAVLVRQVLCKGDFGPRLGVSGNRLRTVLEGLCECASRGHDLHDADELVAILTRLLQTTRRNATPPIELPIAETLAACLLGWFSSSTVFAGLLQAIRQDETVGAFYQCLPSEGEAAVASVQCMLHRSGLWSTRPSGVFVESVLRPAREALVAEMGMRSGPWPATIAADQAQATDAGLGWRSGARMEAAVDAASAAKAFAAGRRQQATAKKEASKSPSALAPFSGPCVSRSARAVARHESAAWMGKDGLCRQLAATDAQCSAIPAGGARHVMQQETMAAQPKPVALHLHTNAAQWLLQHHTYQLVPSAATVEPYRMALARRNLAQLQIEDIDQQLEVEMDLSIIACLQCERAGAELRAESAEAKMALLKQQTEIQTLGLLRGEAEADLPPALKAPDRDFARRFPQWRKDRDAALGKLSEDGKKRMAALKSTWESPADVRSSLQAEEKARKANQAQKSLSEYCATPFRCRSLALNMHDVDAHDLPGMHGSLKGARKCSNTIQQQRDRAREYFFTALQTYGENSAAYFIQDVAMLKPWADLLERHLAEARAQVRPRVCGKGGGEGGGEGVGSQHPRCSLWVCHRSL